MNDVMIITMCACIRTTVEPSGNNAGLSLRCRDVAKK